MEDAISRTSIFVTATGCCDILRPEHFLQMRDNTICCNIGHFDCEVDVAWLEDNCKKDTIKPQVGSLLLHIHCCACCSTVILINNMSGLFNHTFY